MNGRVPMLLAAVCGLLVACVLLAPGGRNAMRRQAALPAADDGAPSRARHWPAQSDADEFQSSLRTDPIPSRISPVDVAAELVVHGAAVSGRVCDPDGKPVEGLLVTLTRTQPSRPASSFPVTTTTDADGAYEFGDLDPGTVTIAVNLSSESAFCPPAPAAVTLPDGRETTGVDFPLMRGLSIVGFVQSDRAEPVSDAVVTVELSWTTATEPAERILRKSAYTDPSGFFEVQGINLDARVTKIEARRGGFLPLTDEPLLPFDRLQELTLKQLGQVLVTATDGSTSMPLQRFRYRFTPESSGTGEQHPFLSWTEPSLFAERGKAHVRDVPPGPWRIELEELTAIGNRTGRRAETVYQVTDGNSVVRLTVGSGPDAAAF